MDKQKFFKVIMDICDWDNMGNDDKVLKPLINYLSQQPDEEIFSFDDIMAELLYALDTRKNFDTALKHSYQNDDSFLYSRCVALINDEAYYNKVLEGKITDIWDMEFESLLYVPNKAWAKKHNKAVDDYPHITPLSYETGSNKAEWQ